MFARQTLFNRIIFREVQSACTYSLIAFHSELSYIDRSILSR